MAKEREHRSRGDLLRAWIFVSLAIVAIAGSAFALRAAQQHSRKEIERTFKARAALASGFTTSFVKDFAIRQRALARHDLSGATVTRSEFDSVASLIGAPAAVSLDSKGRVLQVRPYKSALIGAPIAAKYAHLNAAVHGRVGVSNVVPSAAKGLPVTAVAVPYTDKSGRRRVLSGAFEVAKTPLASYLRNFTVRAQTHIYLVDQAGMIVASNRRGQYSTLRSAEPAVAPFAAMKRANDGISGAGNRTVTRSIPALPWHVVITTPTSLLFEPVSGARRTLPWIAWLAAVLFAIACFFMGKRLIKGRSQLADLNGQLEWMSQRDPLTELLNRRGLMNQAEPLIAIAARERQQLAVLMIDIDHFKSINDKYGHAIGDVVLKRVARCLAESARDSDVVGRWGGEEFIALLPNSDAQGAGLAAERIRELISKLAFESLGEGISLTVSIGLAAEIPCELNSIVARADSALYVAKHGGRDRVVIDGESHFPPLMSVAG